MNFIQGVIMEAMKGNEKSRKSVAIRFVYALFFLLVFELLKMILQVTTLFQYVHLLITKKHSEPVREFSNKLATYAYKVMRYITLNDNDRPFPFSSLPIVMEEGENNIAFP